MGRPSGQVARGVERWSALAAVTGVTGLGTGVLALLALAGLVGGVGITALGPGGVLATIGLFAPPTTHPQRWRVRRS